MNEKEQGHSEPVWNVDEFLERVDNDQVLLRELPAAFSSLCDPMISWAVTEGKNSSLS